MSTSESCNPPCLLGAMDRLWFHQIIFFKESNIISPQKSQIEIISPSLSSSSSDSQPSSNSSFETTDFSDDDIIEEFSYGVHGSLPTILTTRQQIDFEDEDDHKKEMFEEDDIITELSPPKRKNLVMKRVKPLSTSTPTRRRIKTKPRYLERTVSCKTLAELEQEEVKGFMDLGFIFDKNRLTPRMMSVIPGLQRLQGQDDNDENNRVKEEESKRKPYLSEAWLIKKPDSPLLRLRMPTSSTTCNDMKKHIKLWAKTVAYSAIQD